MKPASKKGDASPVMVRKENNEFLGENQESQEEARKLECPEAMK